MRFARVSYLIGMVLIITYVVALAATIIVGRQRFGDINDGLKPPEISTVNAPYRKYVFISTLELVIHLGLAVCLLTVGAGAIAGLAALIYAGFPTFFLLGALPMVYFPGDSYTVQSMWIITIMRYAIPMLGVLALLKLVEACLRRGDRA